MLVFVPVGLCIWESGPIVWKSKRISWPGMVGHLFCVSSVIIWTGTTSGIKGGACWFSLCCWSYSDMQAEEIPVTGSHVGSHFMVWCAELASVCLRLDCVLVVVVMLYLYSLSLCCLRAHATSWVSSHWNRYSVMVRPSAWLSLGPPITWPVCSSPFSKSLSFLCPLGCFRLIGLLRC